MNTYTLTRHGHLPVRYQHERLSIQEHDTWHVHTATTHLSTHLIPAWVRLANAGIDTPPLAAVMVEHTPELQSLAFFAPLIARLPVTARQGFLSLLNSVGHDQRLQIRLMGAPADHAPASFLRLIVALHLSVCFWMRPDTIEQVLQTRPLFAFYRDRTAYTQAGGVGGGCYVPAHHCIMLESQRLCEGFRDLTPGVSPLLHELGHLLDGVSQTHAGWPHPRGELPALTPSQRQQWYAIKQHEVARYQQWYHDQPLPNGYPLGHPYVFQSDGEFLAGYWELFWRCPAYMHQYAPACYAFFCEYVQFDARQAQPVDFHGYPQDNQHAYRHLPAPWPARMQWLNSD